LNTGALIVSNSLFIADWQEYSTQGFGVSGYTWNIGLFQSFSGFSDKIVSIEPNILIG
jgi:hypothetical protein